jgi:hypothetical protein
MNRLPKMNRLSDVKIKTTIGRFNIRNRTILDRFFNDFEKANLPLIDSLNSHFDIFLNALLNYKGLENAVELNRFTERWVNQNVVSMKKIVNSRHIIPKPRWQSGGGFLKKYLGVIENTFCNSLEFVLENGEIIYHHFGGVMGIYESAMSLMLGLSAELLIPGIAVALLAGTITALVSTPLLIGSIVMNKYICKRILKQSSGKITPVIVYNQRETEFSNISKDGFGDGTSTREDNIEILRTLRNMGHSEEAIENMRIASRQQKRKPINP